MSPLRSSGRSCGRLFGGLCVLVVVQHAWALSVPFTENFDSDSANWRDSTGAAVVGWNPTGGPDGSSYATTTLNFLNSGAGTTPIVFRNQEEFNSSGQAFQGNWVTGDVTQLSAYVRHDAGVDLNFFVRFSDPVNFPGAAAVVSTPVPSGQWTQISVAMDPSNFVYEGPFTFNDVFDNIGHVQIGVLTPQSLANQNQSVTFDLDQPSIMNAAVPTVSEWGLAALVLLGLVAGTIMFRKSQADC